MNYLNELERFSIVLFSIIFIIQSLFINFKLYGFGLLGYIINEKLNNIFKNDIAKPLMDKNKFTILGYGTRPKGAKNCGILSDGKLSKSYGMPSGHSQDAMYFATFQFLNTTNIYYKIFVIFIGLWVMFSRVKLGCHTYQQVIIGGIIGSVIAFLWNKLYQKLIK